MEYIKIDSKGVEKLLLDLDERKASGPDNLSARLLKALTKKCTIFYTLHLINISKQY